MVILFQLFYASLCSLFMQVLKLSQFLLIQTAADDAIVRLQNSALTDEEITCLTNWYFKYQQHTSIGEFLQHHCIHQNHDMFMQVHNMLDSFMPWYMMYFLLPIGYYSLSTNDPSGIGGSNW